MDGELSGEMVFSVAAVLWLDLRVKIGPRTRQDYKRYIKALKPFFAELPLKEIHIGHVRQYQKERSVTAGPIVVNKEIGTLLQIRKRARIADELDDFYEPLPLPYWTPPKTITDEQEELFLQALRPLSEMVYCYALLALKTGVRGCELRSLRIGDVNMALPELQVRTAAKNQHAIRRVPLVGGAVWAAERLLQIAAEKGSRAPHHYLFPRRLAPGIYEPDLAMTYSGMKKPWKAACETAGVTDFVPHNSRHQANTKLYESGADDMTVMSIMGHTDRKTSEWYSTIRQKRKQDVMRAAFGGKATATA